MDGGFEAFSSEKLAPVNYHYHANVIIVVIIVNTIIYYHLFIIG